MTVIQIHVVAQIFEHRNTSINFVDDQSKDCKKMYVKMRLFSHFPANICNINFCIDPCSFTPVDIFSAKFQALDLYVLIFTPFVK